VAEVTPSLGQKVDFVIGNQNKNTFSDLLSQAIPLKSASILGTVTDYKDFLSRHPMDREWPALEHDATLTLKQTHTTRAFLKIQEGCNAFCTYCIIPYARGPSRSLSLKTIIQEVQKLTHQGVQEVVLTGTNIGEYGVDFKSQSSEESKLEDLVKTILSETTVSRIRLSSLDPVEISPSLIDLVKTQKRLAKHFHVSLQSPLSKILRLMKRKYNAQDMIQCLKRIEQIPDSFVGMDLITGFPGESEDDFLEGVEVLQQLPWTRLHVFPYSERTQTPATRLPGSVKQEHRVLRTKKLNSISLKRQEMVYQNLLEKKLPKEVLLESFSEKDGKITATGVDGAYFRYCFEWEKQESLRLRPGTFVTAIARKLFISPSQQDIWFKGHIFE
jgi:MiaB/RimO family radical SAM methylthiotransferase